MLARSIIGEGETRLCLCCLRTLALDRAAGSTVTSTPPAGGAAWPLTISWFSINRLTMLAMPLGSGICSCCLKLSLLFARGLGGTSLLEASHSPPPLPYIGVTFTSSTSPLQTGHSEWAECPWSHWYKHGQQKRWPHGVTTGSLAASRQILHSKLELHPQFPSFLTAPIPVILPSPSSFCRLDASREL